MYRKILVALALDHGVSQHTLAVAQQLCGEGGQITALHVLDEPQGSAHAKLREDLLQQGIDRVKTLLDEKMRDYPHITSKLVQGHVARTLVDYADEHGIDCIVMGSHKPGLTDYFLGSTAARVVRHANCAVHVYRAR